MMMTWRDKLSELIEETSDLVSPYLKQTSNDMYVLIAEQLKDIKENILVIKIPFDKDEIDQRYSLGSLAVKNLDSSDKLYMNLVEIFHLCLEFAKDE